LALAGLGNALPFAARKDRHQKVKVVVCVTGEGKRRQAACLRVDAKFFV